MNGRDDTTTIDREIGPHVIVYCEHGGQLVAYATACTWFEMVLQCGYCRAAHPAQDVFAIPAEQLWSAAR